MLSEIRSIILYTKFLLIQLKFALKLKFNSIACISHPKFITCWRKNIIVSLTTDRLQRKEKKALPVECKESIMNREIAKKVNFI